MKSKIVKKKKRIWNGIYSTKACRQKLGKERQI